MHDLMSGKESNKSLFLLFLGTLNVDQLEQNRSLVWSAWHQTWFRRSAFKSFWKYSSLCKYSLLFSLSLYTQTRARTHISTHLYYLMIWKVEVT